MFAGIPAHATDIWGRVQVNVPYGQGWAGRPYANVVLFQVAQNGVFSHVGSYNTGPDGMYYFYNMAPGWSYRVQVNGGPYVDFVLPYLPGFDVMPIWLPN